LDWDGAWRLVVPEASAARAELELRRWAEENVRPRPEPKLRRRASGWDAALGWGLVLATVWLAQDGGALGLAWEPAGVLDAARVAAGAWWRAVTALTLHADPAHLWANVGFGALLVGALGWLLGTGAAWLATLLAGTAGNLAAALLRREGLALGASTAAFAALGLLGALAWRRRAALIAGGLRRWTPMVAATLLLGYLGAEGERVDVLGHVAGFLAGVAGGAALGVGGALRDDTPLAHALDRPATQWACGAATLALLAGAWWLALS
jgi:rhomboid protease GluP